MSDFSNVRKNVRKDNGRKIKIRKEERRMKEEPRHAGRTREE